MSEHEFSVWIFFPEPPGGNVAEARFISAGQAVKLAREITARPAAKYGLIERVIITDGGDYTVFEWTAGKGVTFV